MRSKNHKRIEPALPLNERKPSDAVSSPARIANQKRVKGVPKIESMTSSWSKVLPIHYICSISISKSITAGIVLPAVSRRPDGVLMIKHLRAPLIACNLRCNVKIIEGDGITTSTLNRNISSTVRPDEKNNSVTINALSPRYP